jgi:UDP-glucose 4-epimerase
LTSDLRWCYRAITVGESMGDPLRYYHNITSNTVLLLETMQKFGVNKLVYSSTCATYGGAELVLGSSRLFAHSVPVHPPPLPLF